MTGTSESDRVPYTRYELMRWIVIASIWLIFYGILLIHGLTAMNTTRIAGQTHAVRVGRNHFSSHNMMPTR